MACGGTDRYREPDAINILIQSLTNMTRKNEKYVHQINCLPALIDFYLHVALHLSVIETDILGLVEVPFIVLNADPVFVSRGR